MNPVQKRARTRTIATVTSIILIIAIILIIEFVQNSNKSSNAVSTTSTGSTTTLSTSGDTTGSSASTSTTGGSSSSTSSNTSTYKDGTYTAESSYYVPHGSEQISVTLTVANGVVTDSSIVNSESDHDSQRYQEEFASAYKTGVVGKNLADLDLSYVAGASDTTDGFNDAVSNIRNQAKV